MIIWIYRPLAALGPRKKPVMRKRFFTLLEMIIVISILGLFVSLIGINVNKAIHEQRFRSEVSSIVDTLRLAQGLMMILDNDVTVTFREGTNEIQMQIETACPLAKNWQNFLLTKKNLHTVRVVNFKDPLLPSESGTAQIRFFSAGYVMSRGILHLATVENASDDRGLVSYVCLPGYPSTIKSVSQRPEEPLCYALAEENFVESLTRTTVDEIKRLQSIKKEDSEKKKEETKKEERQKAKEKVDEEK